MPRSRQNAIAPTSESPSSALVPYREPIAERTDSQAHKSLIALRRALLLALIAAFAVKGFLPAWTSLPSDFSNYYLVAKLYRAGYPLERVYEWTWLQRQNDHLQVHQGLVSFIPSTLISAIPLVPLTYFPPLQAKHLWLIANVIFLGCVLYLCVRMTRLGWEWTGLHTLLAFVPLRNNFVLGQMHVVVLLLITIAAWLYFRDSQFWSGISIAAAAILKIYPALFLVFFLWKKRWRAALGLIAGLILFAAVSWYLFGRDAALVYVRQVLPAGLRGETLDPYNPAWNSFTALLRRLFLYEPALNPAPMVHSPVLYALLHPLIHISVLILFLCAIGTRNGDSNRSKLEWGSFLFVLMFLSSQPISYHFVALILAAVLVGDYLVAREHRLLSFCALLIYALTCAPQIQFKGFAAVGWQNFLFFPRLAWMSLLAVILCWALAPRFLHSINFRNIASTVSCIVVLTFLGFVSERNHLQRQFENYEHRILHLSGDLLATDPSISQDTVLFTHMGSRTYTVDQVNNGMPSEIIGSSEDSFHPAAAPSSHFVWAERSYAGGSRIVRVAGGAAGEPAERVEIEDAEQPTISSDGRFLAFLREEKGRNVLMIKNVENENSAPPYPVAGAEFDVHEATFTRGNDLIFSSKAAGTFSLYLSSLDGKVSRLAFPDCPARYPAASPDGQWLAFSCEEGGSWHLMVMRIDGTGQKHLTTGDCNSVSPAWKPDSKHIVYATDCGRGLGLTALAEIAAVP